MKTKNTMLVTAAISGLVLAAGCSSMSADAGAASAAQVGECHGANSCKGTGDCAGKGYSCAGNNQCKGKGWNKMSQSDCDAKGGTFK